MSVTLPFLALALAMPVAAEAFDADAEALAAAVAARHEALHSVAVQYESLKTYERAAPRRREPGTTADGGELTRRESPVVAASHFRRLGRLALYERTYDGATAAAAREEEAIYSRTAFLQGRADRLWQGKGEAAHHGLIDASMPVPAVTIDLALGLRQDYEDQLLEPASWLAPAVTARLEGHRGVLERTDAKGRTHVWEFDPALDWALVRYQVVYEGEVRFDLTCGDFRETAGMALPHEMTARWFAVDGGRRETMREEIRVQRYDIAPPDNTPESYETVWPLDTRVYDARVGMMFEVTSGARTLPDAAVEALAALRHQESALMQPPWEELAEVDPAPPAADLGSAPALAYDPSATDGESRVPRLWIAGGLAGVALALLALAAVWRSRRRS